MGARVGKQIAWLHIIVLDVANAASFYCHIPRYAESKVDCLRDMATQAVSKQMAATKLAGAVLRTPKGMNKVH